MPKYKRRPNGSGTAIKRGKTFQARVVIGWHYDSLGKKLPTYKTKDGFRTRHEAWAYCQTLLNEGDKPKQQTFIQVYDAWSEVYSPRITPSTIRCYSAAIKHFAVVQNIPIKEITIDQLQSCVDKVDARKRTRENMKTLAGLLYKYAIPRMLATLNIATYLHTGENDKERRIGFTVEQIAIIAANVGIIPMADYILVLIYTGFRPAELFDLKRTAYNRSKMVIVGGAKTEAGKNRLVTVSPHIVKILDKRAASDSVYLFPRPSGEQMNATHFRKAYFYPAIAKMGMKDLGLSPYSCRHTFADLMKNVQGSDTDKAALMGHTSFNMTKYYQSADMKSLKAITDRI